MHRRARVAASTGSERKRAATICAMPLHAALPYALARPFLFGLDPERAHELTLGAHRAAAEHAGAGACGSSRASTTR